MHVFLPAVGRRTVWSILAAACCVAAGGLSGVSAAAELQVSAAGQPWPAKIPPPPGMAEKPGPWSDPDDLTVWPNQTSRANSDPWLVTHHDQIRRMNPRVLLLNVSNQAKVGRDLNPLAKQMIDALAEGSRYHGYKNPDAPAFLNYQIFKLVNLRQAGAVRGNSDLSPLKKNNRQSGQYEGYNGFFTAAMAERIGIPDPRDGTRFLRLDELVDGGYIHEVWLFAEHGDGAGFEAIELKAAYDDQFRRLEGKYVQAGNGGDPEQKWTGRSLRIGHFNCSRGVGCFLESLSHSIEGTGGSHAIPYFSKYFQEFAGRDWKTRYSLPFESLYAVSYQGQNVRYPDPQTMVVTHEGKEYAVRDYVAAGGNAHFPPNARNHYDRQNGAPVLSTIEDWRIGSGPGGKDVAKPFTNAAFQRYNDQAPDCMGPWLIYWRQNFPGLDNQSKDEHGKPMKNWWPFLFY